MLRKLAWNVFITPVILIAFIILLIFVPIGIVGDWAWKAAKFITDTAPKFKKLKG